MYYRMLSALTAIGMLAATSAQAQIKVGVTLSTTGPAASLGIPEKNTLSLVPKEIGGQKIEYIILDDASDTTTARKNIEKFTTENNVDVVVGSSITPATLAMTEVAARSRTPVISLAAGIVLIQPQDENKRWIFKTPYNDGNIAAAVVEHMARNGVKKVAHIAFNDAYGESWATEFEKVAKAKGLEVVAAEKYNRTDTSVTAQILKIISAKPDAVLIIAAGTPAVLPQATLKERGFKNRIYQTSGVINNEFLRVGGKNVEGTLLPGGPVIVVDQLPDGHPAKKPSQEYKKSYEAAFGANTLSTFGANAWDAILILQAAIPEALKKAKPGSVEFRVALRDAIESVKNLPTTHGVVTMTPQDHNGYSLEAPAMITVKDGNWALAK
ncbi:ABC transporter substrate-binding protein [Pseudorhodoplanes sp.]|uniref:ABC transporter substrate-binding protein n=1 Tax=Pseudorhodoplanes sp. TaxID=1934341 RepID=UPI003D0C4122